LANQRTVDHSSNPNEVVEIISAKWFPRYEQFHKERAEKEKVSQEKMKNRMEKNTIAFKP